MILVDTSVWIAHFRKGGSGLAELLSEALVLVADLKGGGPRYQFVMDPSGLWNIGMGRERSVISAASWSGLVSSVTPRPGRRLGHILPLWKS